MRERLAVGVLLFILTLLAGWPFLATVNVARRGEREAGAGLLSPVSDSGSGLRRPLALAGETTRLVAATALLAVPVGTLLGFLLFRTDLAAKGVALVILGLAAFVPLPLHAGAWLGALGNAGRAQALGLNIPPLLVGWPGAAVVHALAALPWVVLITGVGFRLVEPELEELARLDLPAFQAVWAVTFRRNLAAIAAAALAVAVLTASDMTVTDLLQVRTYAEEAYLQYNLGNGPSAAAAVALPPLLVLGSLIFAAGWTLGRVEPNRWLSARNQPSLWRLGAWRIPLGLATLVFIGLFAGFPVASLVWRAGRVGGLAHLRQPPRWSAAGLAGSLRLAWDDSRDALLWSVLWALAAALIAVAVAWSLAWLCRRQAGWRILSAILLALTLATPGPVAGFALVYAYRSWGWLYDSAWMIVLAMTLRTLPYAFLLVWPAVRGLPQELFDSATLDGLLPFDQAWRIAWPLSRSGITAAFAASFTPLGELPATNLVTPPGCTPLSVVIWGLLHTGVESHTAGVVLIQLAAVACAGLFTLMMLRRVH
ncbi:MAG: ABC transporter permease subunit [Isosphaeraceae bacterium]